MSNVIQRQKNKFSVQSVCVQFHPMKICTVGLLYFSDVFRKAIPPPIGQAHGDIQYTSGAGLDEFWGPWVLCEESKDMTHDTTLLIVNLPLFCRGNGHHGNRHVRNKELTWLEHRNVVLICLICPFFMCLFIFLCIFFICCPF